ncbi:MAG TPA: TGS domain-containing protein [Nostoc sp.]|uniref:RelA/SpoT family protein n=1 Tax=Nostoc sp. TaxID=1180 RepID=UPI002D729212|nr:TGS domain-containing protein [Nostoc sp.]HYX16799.1 TGS domain-containing protein [Nostoc sp.]
MVDTSSPMSDQGGKELELKTIAYNNAINAIKSIETTSENKKIFEKKLEGKESKAKFIFYTLYDLTNNLTQKDEDIITPLSGLIYTLYFDEKLLKFDVDDKLLKNFENIKIDKKPLNVLPFIETLVFLNRLTSQKIINSLDDDSDVEEIIMMVFVTMSQEKDIRALVIELVHRLSILKNKDFFKQNILTNEQNNFLFITFKIFVPIANRLGFWSIKWELEDLCFKGIKPKIYTYIKKLLKEKRADRENFMNDCINYIEDKIVKNGLPKEKFKISGRPKSIYSTYTKMKQLYSYSQKTLNRKISLEGFSTVIEGNFLTFKELFEGVHDLLGIRIICCDSDENCDSNKDKLKLSKICYDVLDIIQQNFTRQSTFIRKYGELVDYIAAPKQNGYQSIHLVVHAPLVNESNIQDHRKLEVQIRTEKMHQQAEYGVAAHWKYKELGYSQRATNKDFAFTALKEYIDQNGLSAAQDFLKEKLDTNLFGSHIYVFTPDKNVVSLKKGSTPVDFAYHIHTEVGNHTTGVRINDRMVPLLTQLKNGDIVEITTQKNGHPSLDWLNFVQTSLAKNRIKQWHKRSRRKENIDRGRELLEKELSKTGFENLLRSKFMQTIAEKCNYQSVEDLLAALGYGEKSTSIYQVINLVREKEKEEAKAHGWKILERAFVNNNLKISYNSEFILEAAQRLNYQTDDDLLAALGESAKVIDVNEVIKILREVLQGKSSVEVVSLRNKSNHPANISDKQHPIKGIEGLLYYRAGCCQPIPAEPIVGIVTRSDGISIHHQNCKNVQNLLNSKSGSESNQYEGLTVSWNDKSEQTYLVDIKIETNNRIGILKDITSYLADKSINISEAIIKTYPYENKALINLSIDIKNLQNLENCKASIKQIKDVINVNRVSEMNVDYNKNVKIQPREF